MPLKFILNVNNLRPHTLSENKLHVEYYTYTLFCTKNIQNIKYSVLLGCFSALSAAVGLRHEPLSGYWQTMNAFAGTSVQVVRRS